MAVDRTNNVSSEISKLDGRLKALESSTVIGSISGTLTTTTAAPSSDNNTPYVPETIRAADAPYTYKRVQEAWVYDDRVTGAGSRAEIYFAESPEISLSGPTTSNNHYVRVSGIRGNSTSVINISSANLSVDEVTSLKYRVYATDTPPWDDEDYRGEGADGKLRQSWRDEPGAGITHTVFYNPKVSVNSNSGVQLIAKRQIDSVTASNTTVTIVTNSLHRFEPGDVISVDLDAPLYGVDGLFKVATVPSTTSLTYELDSALTSPISLSGGTLGTKYVYPVAQRYVQDGSLWIETDTDPNKIYVWKDYRWYDTAEPVGDVAAVKDGIAPSPVTNLTATSTTIPGVNGQGGTAEITVSWTPPTTRSNGDPIDDYLGYYEIQYKRSTELNWTGKLEVDGSASSAIIRDPFIRLQTQYDIRVYVYDIMEQASTAVSTTVITTNFSEVLNAPSTPVLTTRLGTITVTWDGLDSVGNTPPQGVQFVEVHYSTTTGFTPSSSTLYTTFPLTLEGNYAVVSDLSYNTTYYFKLIFVRSDGYSNEKSAASAQASAQVAPLVDTDIIYSTLNNWPFNGGVVPAGALASGAISASNMFGANVVVQNAIAANAIGADQIAANAVIAGKIGADAITTNTIAAGAITAGKIESNAIEADKIAAGAITASIIGSKEIELKATPTATQRIVLNASGITAYNGNDTTFFINGVSGTINAAAITVNNVNASNITTGTLSADRIAAESITAGKLETNLTISNLIRTGAAGTDRIEIRGANINNPGIVHVIGGVGEGNFRFYTNGVSYLNNLQLANANLTGTLTVSGTVSGGSFTGGSFTGGTFRTASGTDQRVIISGTTNRAAFYNTGASDASPTGYIQGTSLGLTLNAASQISFEPGGSQVAYVSSSGMGFNGADKRWIGTFSGTASVQSGNGSVILGSTGNISADGSITAAGNITSTGGNVVSDLSVTSGTTVIVGVMNTTSLAANVRHGANGSALTRFTSDSRIKDNITTITTGLDIVNQLNPVTFNSLVDDTDRLIPGFIAQDLEEVFDESIQIVTKIDSASLDTSELPEGIDVQSDPLRSIETVHLLPYLVKAIQELSQQNSELQARIAALEGTT